MDIELRKTLTFNLRKKEESLLAQRENFLASGEMLTFRRASGTDRPTSRKQSLISPVKQSDEGRTELDESLAAESNTL